MSTIQHDGKPFNGNWVVITDGLEAYQVDGVTHMRALPSGGASADDISDAVDAHVLEPDPHSQYQTKAALLAALALLLDAGANISITNAAGKLTIAATGVLTSASALDATKLTGSIAPARLANGDYVLNSLSVEELTVMGSLTIPYLQVDGPSTLGGLVSIAQSTWDGAHLVMGSYHFWVDGTGRLRVKNGEPTSATDGTVVGTQS